MREIKKNPTKQLSLDIDKRTFIDFKIYCVNKNKTMTEVLNAYLLKILENENINEHQK